MATLQDFVVFIQHHLPLLGKSVIYEVWVCDKITDLIIGIDFIQTHKLAYPDQFIGTINPMPQY